VIESNQRVPVARRRKLTVSGTGKALILSVEGREQPIALLDVSEGGVLLQEPDDRRVAVVRDGIVRARQWGYSHGAAPSLGDAVPKAPTLFPASRAATGAGVVLDATSCCPSSCT